MTDNTSPTVFIVDDEKVIATTLAIILRQSGFNAFAFTRPHDALASARVACPDIVVSDVMMPEMLGTELAVELTKMCSRMKILLFSGQAATADFLAKVKNKGHTFEILGKPVHPADLIAAIKRLQIPETTNEN